MWRRFCLVLVTSQVGGCAFYLPKDLVSKDEVTLQRAMSDSANSLVAFRDVVQDAKLRTGLIVDEVDVVFNISATANAKDQLTIEASQPAAAGAFLATSLKNDFSIENAAQRGNQITIKLRNSYSIAASATSKQKLGRPVQIGDALVAALRKQPAAQQREILQNVSPSLRLQLEQRLNLQ